MFEQDYVMRMIKEIARVLAKILFNSESETIEEDLLEELKKAEMSKGLGSLIDEAEEINEIRLITKRFEDYGINDLRELSDQIKADNKNVVMVFAAVSGGKVTFLVSVTDDLVDKGLHAGKMIKEIAAAAGGGGGGKADMAQAGAKDPSKVDAAFEKAVELMNKA